MKIVDKVIDAVVVVVTLIIILLIFGLPNKEALSCKTFLVSLFLQWFLLSVVVKKFEYRLNGLEHEKRYRIGMWSGGLSLVLLLTFLFLINAWYANPSSFWWGISMSLLFFWGMVLIFALCPWGLVVRRRHKLGRD